MNFLRAGMTDLLGWAEVCLGKEPHFIGSSRMALEQWKYAASCASPPTKGPLLIAAVRNRRWVEWSVFSACYALTMGYRPILIFSGEEMAAIYQRHTLAKHLHREFWDAVKSIPFITTVDLDDFLGSPDDDYAAFARENTHLVTAYDLRVEEFEGAETGGEYDRA